jgi:DNA-binding response OmpR family regulator
MKDIHTILFVDDYKAIRDFCQREFEKEGYGVILAGNGEEALTALSKYTIDIVILDFRMPKVDGLETIKRIRQHTEDIPVIFFTAHSEYIPANGRVVGADACIEKSDDLKELKSAVARLIGRRRYCAGNRFIQMDNHTP